MTAFLMDEFFKIIFFFLSFCSEIFKNQQMNSEDLICGARQAKLLQVVQV